MVELSLEPSEDLEVDLGSSSDDEMEQESSSGSEEESGEGTEPSSSEEEDEDDDMSDCSEEEADSMDLKPAAKSSLAKQTTQAKPQRKPPPKQPPKAKVAAIPKALPKTAPKVALPKPKAVEQKPAAPADEDDAAVQECSSPRDAENQDCHEEVGLMVERGSGRAQVDDADDDALPLTAQEQEQRRDANIRALVEGSLDIHRKSMMPKLLTVQDAAAVTLRRPFKSPHPNAPARSHDLQRRLIARKQFVPWGAGRPFQPVKLSLPQQDLPDTSSAAASAPPPAIELPPGVEPLILWEPSPSTGGPCVKVDDALTRFLRPHQREGVQFMFECVAGLRPFDGQGCILADDMGLGKTLQGITLLWTLLNNGHEELGGMPMARRVIICCPTSLVSNWDSECTKWLNGRVRTLPLCESSREDVIATINQFLSPRCPAQLLIVSYETFRLHAERFQGPDACDLLICDEAHRLKNDQTLTNKALDSLACRRRVLLSGTPMQNQLQEFYSMVNFCNPGVLGTPAQFRRHFETPVLAGREPDATDTEKELGQERSAELSSIVNDFILRRTNSLLSKHLPPKVVEVVCCRMTPLQYQLYCHFVQSRSVRSLFSAQKSARVLSAITSLRKLLNHPKLIYDASQSSAHGKGEKAADGFEGCADLFPEGLFDSGRGARGALPSGWENLSGKFAVVSRMLALMREQTRDRVVIVSNYTQTLDLFTSLCRERGYPVLRLDGSTSISKRQKLVKQFNDMNDNQFVFLLSSKAGGCGLNLVGGNRLILFDMSWNPADDKQAAARVWRDGQQRRVYVYRFMTTGTIEEKVYQRQLSKEGLQAVVDSKAAAGAAESNLMSLEELRDLFSYDPATLSTTYDHMVAGKKRKKRKSKRRGGGDKHGKGGDSEVSDADEDDFKGDSESEEEEEEDEDAVESDQETVGEAGDTAGGIKLQKSADVVAAGGRILTEQAPDPKEDDLATWAHHSDPTTVPDQVMKLTGGEEVTFVFSCKVDGREVPDDAPLVPFGQAERPINHAGAGLGPKAVSVGPRRGAVGVSSLRPGAASAPGPGVQAGAVVRKALVARKTPPLPKSLTASAPPRPRVTPPSASGKDAANGKENAEDVVDLTKSTPKQPLQKAKGATPVLTKPEAAVSAPKRPPVSVSAPPTKPKAPTAAGSKRRFSAGAVAAEAAAAGASKRTAVLYDSDDDFV